MPSQTYFIDTAFPAHPKGSPGRQKAPDFQPGLFFKWSLCRRLLRRERQKTQYSGGRGTKMGVRELLEGAAFDPETIRALCAAYDKAKKELHDTGQPDVVREVIARKIIKLAEAGEQIGRAHV